MDTKKISKACFDNCLQRNFAFFTMEKPKNKELSCMLVPGISAGY